MGGIISQSLSSYEIQNYLKLYYQNLTLLPEHKIRGNKHLICNKCHSTNLTITKTNLEWKCNFCDNRMDTIINKPSIVHPFHTGSSIMSTIPKIYLYFRDGYPDLAYDLKDYQIIKNNGHPFDKNINFESFRDEMISCVPFIKEKYGYLEDFINEYYPDNYIHKEGL